GDLDSETRAETATSSLAVRDTADATDAAVANSKQRLGLANHAPLKTTLRYCWLAVLVLSGFRAVRKASNASSYVFSRPVSVVATVLGSFPALFSQTSSDAFKESSRTVNCFARIRIESAYAVACIFGRPLTMNDRAWQQSPPRRRAARRRVSESACCVRTTRFTPSRICATPRVAVFNPARYRICSIVGAAAGGGEGAGAGTGGGGTESLCVTVSWYATTVITITNPSNIADHSSNS